MNTTVNKPTSLQHAKTIHRPLISYVCVEALTLVGSNSSLLVSTEIDNVLKSAGRNQTPVPYQASNDIDTMGVVINTGENRVLLYQNGSQNVLNDANGEEIYARISISGDDYLLSFLTLDDTGTENPAIIPAGDYDFFVPYRFSFEKLPDDALIRVKSKRVNDDAVGGGGREVMQIVTISDLNSPDPLAFTPIPGSYVWGHVDGHSVDSLPGGAFSHDGKILTWEVSVASYDLETTDRFAVHYETYDFIPPVGNLNSDIQEPGPIESAAEPISTGNIQVPPTGPEPIPSTAPTGN